MTLPWKTAWVTGASTGIGRALSLKLAQSGVRVAASARSLDKLTDLSRTNPNILPVPVDVTKPEDVLKAHSRIISDVGPIDLAILNAGVWHPMPAKDYDPARATESITVNYLGIVNALGPLIPGMISAGGGHLALVGSVAGYRGLPKASAYAPSKAAVISLAEVLRLELGQKGIVVSLINPGFVETPMTSVNQFPMPFIIKADDAADRILRGLKRGKFEIAFPWQLAGMLKILRVLPNSLYLSLSRRL